MHTYLITLKRNWTLEDLQSCVNIRRRYQRKTALVQANNEAEATKKVFATGDYEGFEVDSVMDWDELRTVQMFHNLEYIMGGTYAG